MPTITLSYREPRNIGVNSVGYYSIPLDIDKPPRGPRLWKLKQVGMNIPLGTGGFAMRIPELMRNETSSQWKSYHYPQKASADPNVLPFTQPLNTDNEHEWLHFGNNTKRFLDFNSVDIQQHETDIHLGVVDLVDTRLTIEFVAIIPNYRYRYTTFFSIILEYT